MVIYFLQWHMAAGAIISHHLISVLVDGLELSYPSGCLACVVCSANNRPLHHYRPWNGTEV